MPQFKQAGRLMQFSSAFGQDVLLIETLDGIEGISRLFDFQAELMAETGTDLDPNDIVGTKVTVAINLLDAQAIRYVNGFVASFEQTAGDTEFDVYRVHMVPSLWQLTLATNCRVFQDKTVMDIIKEVIQPYGLSVGDVTKFAYKPLDYCTQFNETDFHFISRLAEQHGIFYWFEHSDNDNKVMFGDDISAYTPCPNVSSIQYSPQMQDKETMYHSVVSDLRVTSSMVTGKHTTSSWDYRPFEVNHLGPENSTHDLGKNGLERYSFPAFDAGYVKDMSKQLTTPNHGARYLGAQRDASDVSASVFHGASTARSFTPGFTFTLTDHTRDAWNQVYLLMEVSHHAVQTPPYSSDAGGVRMPYSNRFLGIEASRTYRPEVRTPRPRMSGPQIAVVVTPEGEDQYMDAMGRICVRFMWDRTAGLHKVDKTWVRVSQVWASRGFGAFFWPRLDDEVIVDFFDGDPDDPVVIGSLYNGNAQPKYALPDMQTRSGIVTRSSKEGAAANANELRFEDKKGSEQIFINAEKDFDLRVENDRRTYVMKNNAEIIDVDKIEKIGGKYHSHVVGETVIAIDGKRDTTVGGMTNEKFSGNFNRTIGGDHLEKIGGKQGLEITGDMTHKYGGKMTAKITGDHQEKNANYAMASDQTVYIKGGMTVVIEAGMQLSLKGPGGFIDIGPAGVAISGTMVMINSGGAAGSGQAPSPENPDAPPVPASPDDPDKADDGTKGGKM